MAMEPLTGKVAWQVPLMDFASSAGMLATDGGLLFTGLLTGEVVALDQDNGKTLWQFKTGSSVNAPPITYTHKGRQYLTVLSGRSEEHTSELQSRLHLVCRLLLEKKKCSPRGPPAPPPLRWSRRRW